MSNHKLISIVGAGLAGCEAAYQCLKAGFKVKHYEMRPLKMTPAHKTADFAELVCSNSLRSNNVNNAVGLLKKEMECLDSLIISSAYKSQVAAGSALAVDRTLFSKAILERLLSFKNYELHRLEVTDLKALEGVVIVASGPLSSSALATNIQTLFEAQSLYFFDAVAPIIEASSIDMSICYRKSRYDQEGKDYINCPMNQHQYRAFHQALLQADTVALKDFEDDKVFEGCMPIEVMAKRGFKTLVFGPLKPVGLSYNNHTPYAVVQLRQDDVSGRLYNLVGFQTHLTWPAQKKIIQMIPGLHNAKVMRYGVMHRNTYVCSPKLLNAFYQSKTSPRYFFAGQITGVEGYVESAASGLYASHSAMFYAQNKPMIKLSNRSMMGALAHYVSHAHPQRFSPMNANFGILAYTDKTKRVTDALKEVDLYRTQISTLFK